MDINDLKNGSEIQTLNEKAKSLFEEFKSVCDELSKLTTVALNKKKQELITEFNNFFRDNGFKVEFINNKYVASYEETEVILKDEDPESTQDEGLFSLDIPSKKLYSTIVIKPNSISSDMIYWKRILKGPDGGFINFNNYENQIHKLNDDYLLKEMLKKIQENIDWYNETISKFDNVQYIYSPYKGLEEYYSFAEYFKHL